MSGNVKSVQKKNSPTQFNLNKSVCSGDYQNSFFTPFNSFSDAKKNVKALAVLPIINLSLALHSILNSLVATTFCAVNLITGVATVDLEELQCAGSNLGRGIGNLVDALSYAIFIITDTLGALARLVTHTLATVALGVHKTGEALSEYFAPSSAMPI